MTIEELLAQVLGGGQQPINRMAGNWNGPDSQPNRLVAPQAGPPAVMAPRSAPVAVQQQRAPVAQQQAPVAAPRPSGGGVGGFLGRLFGGGAADDENYTVNWLTQQGMDPGTATMVARHKPALQAYLLERSGIGGGGSDAGFSLSPGEQRYDAQGNLIATGPAKGKKRDLSPEEVAARGYPAGSYQLDEATGDVTTVGGQREQDPGFARELDIRSKYDVDPNTLNYKKIRDSYERVRVAVAAGNGVDDIGIVFGYMKMLDPGSNVMEGERTSAAEAGGKVAHLVNIYNSMVNGETLTPEVRQKFLKSSARLYKEAASNLGDTNARYERIAKKWQLDPENIIQTPEEYPNLLMPDAEAIEVAPNVTVRPLGG